jgi:LCP family protein required for cell wall assembly
VTKTPPKHAGEPAVNPPKPVGGPRARLKRRWPRRTLITVNGVVFLCLVAMASAYGYVRYEIGSIATGPGGDLTPPGFYAGGAGPAPQATASDGLQPENILLIGNETRQGLTLQEQQQFGSSITYSGTLADIMMVLHLDPANRTASVLSIPRDLFSPMPVGSPVGPYQKMDAALNDGAQGPDNLVEAIQEDLGIPINHFVELNFNGFINSVNALGGIKVYFPDPVFDADSLLYIPTAGCRHLNGFYALTLVRARHLQYDPPGDTEPRQYWPYDPESDLARIVRTHMFIKVVADTAKSEGKTNPATAVSFLSAVVKQMTVDAGLKNQFLSLVLHYRDINVAAVPETTLSTTDVNDYYYGGYGMGDVLFPVQPADNNVIKAWDPAALPTPVAPKSVSVVSITGSYGSAVAAGQALASHGLKISSETTGTVPSDISETLVLYHPKNVAQALYVMKYLSGAVMMQLSSAVAPGTVEVDLGSTVNVAAKPLPATTTTAATTATGSTTTTLASTTTTLATTTTTLATTTTGSTTTGGATATSTTRPTGTTTSVPTPNGQPVSSAADQQEPWDPRAC